MPRRQDEAWSFSPLSLIPGHPRARPLSLLSHTRPDSSNLTQLTIKEKDYCKTPNSDDTCSWDIQFMHISHPGLEPRRRKVYRASSVSSGLGSARANARLLTVMSSFSKGCPGLPGIIREACLARCNLSSVSFNKRPWST